MRAIIDARAENAHQSCLVGAVIPISAFIGLAPISAAAVALYAVVMGKIQIVIRHNSRF